MTRPATPGGRTVEIRYRRLPDREQCFRQAVLEDAGGRVVTFLAAAELSRPVMVDGKVVLEPGSPVVWTTYRGLWHDVGRFHRADGTYTGTYANVLTPVRMDGDAWSTTDLCLDVWVDVDGGVQVLDEDELAEALRRGWLTLETAARARAEAERLVDAARQGAWPPPHVAEWTLERARAALASADPKVLSESRASDAPPLPTSPESSPDAPSADRSA